MMRQRCRYKFYASSLLLIYEGEVRTGPRPPAVADPEPVAVAAPVAAQPQPLTPPPRTKCTRRVPHPVLTGREKGLRALMRSPDPSRPGGDATDAALDAPPSPSLPYGLDTSRPSSRTNRTRLDPDPLRTEARRTTRRAGSTAA
jgi:hypothetical protein